MDRWGFRHIRATAVLFVFALGTATRAPAQDWNNVKVLTVGTNVRIALTARTLTGQVHDVTDDSLTVDLGKGRRTFTRQEVQRVSVRIRGHRGRNALIGFGVAASIGAGVGAAIYQSCTSWCMFPTSRGQDAGLGALIFGIPGALIGALIPTGGWYEVYKQ